MAADEQNPAPPAPTGHGKAAEPHRDPRIAKSWQRVELARHQKRPHARDYIHAIFTKFSEIHGDRLFGDDKSILAGMAFFDSKPVMVVAQQKGRDTKEKIMRNFGMPKPEGYRKAMRIMELAAKFGRPIITFIDTPGAYPGLDAEERGQAEAIAYNLREMARLRTPIVSVVIGEGGSGGALGIGVANRVYMLDKRVLQRDFSGKLCGDHLSGRNESAGSIGGAANDGGGFAGDRFD